MCLAERQTISSEASQFSLSAVNFGINGAKPLCDQNA